MCNIQKTGLSFIEIEIVFHPLNIKQHTGISKDIFETLAQYGQDFKINPREFVFIFATSFTFRTCFYLNLLNIFYFQHY